MLVPFPYQGQETWRVTGHNNTGTQVGWVRSGGEAASLPDVLIPCLALVSSVFLPCELCAPGPSLASFLTAISFFSFLRLDSRFETQLGDTSFHAACPDHTAIL